MRRSFSQASGRISAAPAHTCALGLELILTLALALNTARGCTGLVYEKDASLHLNPWVSMTVGANETTPTTEDEEAPTSGSGVALVAFEESKMAAAV